ncbi:MAG: outer membrane protein transport protein [Desulfobacterales bacterium]|nr:outer membrane protein transport protein [Desulfobacterales bacterium]
MKTNIKKLKLGYFQQISKVILFLIICVLLSVPNLWASGFALYENSSSGAGVCGAFVAQADDTSAVFYNPAGMTQLDTFNVMTGFTSYTATNIIEFESGEKEKLKGSTIPVPELYMSYGLNDKIWLGLGIFSPFGLSSEYDSDWKGRYNFYYGKTVCIEYNPSIALKFDTFSIAFGVSYQTFEVELKQKIQPKTVIIKGIMASGLDQANALQLYEYQFAKVVDTLPDINQAVKADDNGWRYNIALLYKPCEKFSFGAHYRSKIKYNLEGDAAYSNVPQDPALMLSSNIYNSSLSGKIELPDILWVGAAYWFSEKLVAEFDVVRTGWSSYDKLEFNIKNGIGATVVNKNWDDVYCYRLGIKYQLSECLVGRIGYLFDECPIPESTVEYSMPASDRHMFTLGLGYTYKKITFDTHYAFITLANPKDILARPEDGIIEDSKVTDCYTHQLGFTISYNM